MRNLRLMLLTAIALAVVAVAAPVTDARTTTRQAEEENCAAADSRPGEATVAEIRSATLCLINTERRQQGRTSLRLNMRLGIAATRFTSDMVDDGFFSHISPNGSTLVARVKKTGYINGARAWSLGENLAWGTGGLATPRQTVASWMRSSGHRANILNAKFREIGIGFARGTPSGTFGGATYTTDFGRRV
jgi:uncharacterized protein YkwD